MKRVIAVILTLVSILILCAACAAQDQPEILREPVSEQDQQTPPAQPPETESHIPAEPAEITGEVQLERNTRGELYRSGDGTTILRATISVPHVTDERYPDAAAVINRYYQTRQDSHLDYAEQELFAYADYAYTNSGLRGEDFIPHSTERYFDVHYNQNGYLSILTTVVESSGTEYSDLSVVAETFEMSGGGLVTGAYLFRCEAEEAAARVLGLILSQISGQIEAGETAYYEGWERLAEQAFQLDRFFLTEEGIVFYYQLYELGHETLGVPEFLIKYDEVADIFNLW